MKQFANKYLGGPGIIGSYEILEFDPLTEQWKLVNRMIQAREHHAVSVLKYSEVVQFCNWGVGGRWSNVREWESDEFSWGWLNINIVFIDYVNLDILH